MENRECCGTCRFWVKDKEKIEGEIEFQGDCVPRSPRPFMVVSPNPLNPREPMISNVTLFPRTKEGKWCGDYKPRLS